MTTIEDLLDEESKANKEEAKEQAKQEKLNEKRRNTKWGGDLIGEDNE